MIAHDDGGDDLENPFITALGPIPTTRDLLRSFTREPAWGPADRRLSHQERRYCTLRLSDFAHPRMCQLQVGELITMMIRHGYRHRNPRRGGHTAAILAAAERREREDLGMVSTHHVVFATQGFYFLGYPGMGKTTTVDRTLARIPRLVRPDVAGVFVQVPWLKVECPSGGTRKQFCLAFLEALGARVGVDYKDMYKGAKGADDLMLVVQQLVAIHALGALVVDEIQHLRRSTEGAALMMSFFVTLINVIGVPVLLIGTMGGASVVGNDLRDARRASGFGSPTWERVDRGEDWEDFARDMWRFQWTDADTPYSAELGATLYDECQGILDVAVRIYTMVQMRAIWRGEMIAGANETITPALIRKVCAEDFRVIRPMMAGLRDGRPEILARWPDLTPLHGALKTKLEASANVPSLDAYHREKVRQDAVRAAQEVGPKDGLAPLRASLAGRGVVGDDAEAILAEAIRRHPEKDLIAMVATVGQLLAALGTGAAARLAAADGASADGSVGTAGPAAAPAAPVKPAAPPAPSASAVPSALAAPAVAVKAPRRAASPSNPRDLRVIARGAKKKGMTVHEAFVSAGVCKAIRAIADA